MSGGMGAVREGALVWSFRGPRCCALHSSPICQDSVLSRLPRLLSRQVRVLQLLSKVIDNSCANPDVCHRIMAW